MIDAMEAALTLHTSYSSARLILAKPTRPYGNDEEYRRMWMKLVDDGMAAELEVWLSTIDQPPLDTFLLHLAESWQGWQGVKTWRAVGRHLELDARHDGRALVRLGVTLTPWRSSRPADPWSVRVVFILEPGEQMRQFAEGVGALLDW